MPELNEIMSFHVLAACLPEIRAKGPGSTRFGICIQQPLAASKPYDEFENHGKARDTSRFCAGYLVSHLFICQGGCRLHGSKHRMNAASHL